MHQRHDPLDLRRLVGTFIDIARMRDARVLVAGVGALGNETVKNLAMMGVGKLLLVDLDIIEFHNLSRSVFFFFGDAERAIQEGTPKARFVAEMIRALNPAVDVQWYHGDIGDLGPGIFGGFDVAISCLDGEVARYIMNERCARAHIPMIDSGLGETYRSSARTYVHVISAGPNTACYACRLLPERREALTLQYQRTHFSCGQIGAIIRERGGIPSSIIMASVGGALQAMEAAKLICGRKDMFGGRPDTLLSLELSNIRAARCHSDPLKRDLSCPHHAYPANAVVWLELRSDEASLEDVLRLCQERWGAEAEEQGGEVVLGLPGQYYPAVVCTECAQRHTWINATQSLLSGAWLEGAETAGTDLPDRLRLPCGCPRGRADVADDEIPSEVYPDAEGPRAEAALRASRFSWGEVFPVWLGRELVGLVSCGGDLHHLTGWIPRAGVENP